MDAWTRALPPVATTGAIYLQIQNNALKPDRLLSAKSSKAARLAIHTHEHSNGIVKMRPLDELILAPGERVLFATGGLHLMMFGLTSPLVAGERFPLQLVFEQAGPVVVEVSVLEDSPAQAVPESKTAPHAAPHGGVHSQDSAIQGSAHH